MKTLCINNGSQLYEQKALVNKPRKRNSFVSNCSLLLKMLWDKRLLLLDQQSLLKSGHYYLLQIYRASKYFVVEGGCNFT